MQFTRKQKIEAETYPGRILVIYGPRRIGKATMLKAYLERCRSAGKKVLYLTGDDIDVREIIGSQRRDRILAIASSYDIVAIDEAQQVPHIGLGAKMLIDAMPEKQFILTGSSSFDLSQRVGEPLTGRHFELRLLPVSASEIDLGTYELSKQLDRLLIYGAYPEMILDEDLAMRKEKLNELVSSYLLKDILALDKVRAPDKILILLRALSFQIGSEVSVHELAKTVSLDGKTVQRYLDILEKMFVIKKVRAYTTNQRNELTKKSKYFFYDLGVRNAIIGQFNPLEKRDDVGKLWENFVFMELFKRGTIEKRHETLYFWRTLTGQEVDIIVEHENIIRGIECKWSEMPVKTPPQWSKMYPRANISVVHKNNWIEKLVFDNKI